MKFTENRFWLAATDLANHLGCAHLTQLSRKVARDGVKKPSYYDPTLDVLIQRGKDHEAAYVKYLSEVKGLTMINLTGKPMEAVEEAMKAGVDVIVQANLRNEMWVGFADILVKIIGKSRFGDWTYEVQDTKLSQDTRAGTILQLSLYTEILSGLLGHVPAQMHVVKPGQDFPTESYRVVDFLDYYAFVKKKFEQVMAGEDLATYPDPVEQCSICQWWQVCDKQRHDDDHLSLVAGLRSMHMVELERQRIFTLEAFALAPILERPERGNRETFARKQQQAKIQLESRRVNKILHDVLPVEAGRGFNRLPVPDAGDVYFDIEGDPFFADGGIEYLLGFSCVENDAFTYKGIWSFNRRDERKAFEAFMSFLVARWKRHPNMYIYHFAPYEPAAIKRLARVHAVFEKEVDDLLRAERFIDLHAVFKEALLAGVETYSLKELEKFTKYVRKVELRDASSARKIVEIALETGLVENVPPATKATVQDYNEDDCMATEALHRWLEDLRREIARTHSLTRPEIKTGEATENVQNLDTRALALYKSLTASLPEDRESWSDEQKAKWLLAHQIDYFRREDKSAWWEYFRVHELEHDDLLDERKAIAGLRFVSVQPRIGKERNVTHRYSFPPQEVSLDEGDAVVEVKGKDVGTIRAISPEEGFVDIKKSAKAADIHPVAVHVSERVDPGLLATSLMAIATAIDDDGLSRSWPYHAAKDLLMKRPPRLNDGTVGAFILPGEDPVSAAVRIALSMDRTVFAIQGPPGAGKTFTGASMVLALAAAGKKIGITAVSHKVIRNMAEACLKRASATEASIAFVHKVKEESETPLDGISETTKSDIVRDAVLSGKVACGTAWLWAEDASQEKLDYLFVDEAGQMSLSQVLAASRAAKNIILLGDPQQLEQPQRGSHPEGSDVAALAYLLDGASTMPEGKGLFLAVTRRLHPALCQFNSDLYYEGRLQSLDGLEHQRIGGGTAFDGAGLFFTPVEHRGNQNRSPEEANAIEKIVRHLLHAGRWTDATGKTSALSANDILIVAPYNAQVALLRERLPHMRVGTVDKFQGQEAPVVIYSLTSSTVADAPKGMSFLFNPNRLNVATSRAKCACMLVASPTLLEPDCRTIEQMRWANALCRYRDMAEEVKTDRFSAS